MQSQCTSSTDLPLATSNKIELTHMISHENTREKEMEKNKPRCSHYTAHGALMSPACATQAISTATALLDVLSSLGPGRTLATCSPLTSSILSTSQGPGARPHCALVFNRGSGGASSSCSPAPAHACQAQGWPHACRPRHCVQARDHLWYGREDHDRHTAATRCANPTRDHPRLCARHARCRQPSATSPISQDTRLR